jgi:hypothetical protein
MAGRITYRSPSRHAGGVVWKTYTLTARDLDALTAALGRPLSAGEAEEVAQCIARWRFGRAIDTARPSAQDVKRTLSALAVEPDGRIFTCWTHADATSRSLLRDALVFDLGVEAVIPTPAMLRRAAALAAARVDFGSGARTRGYQIIAAAGAKALWCAFGGGGSPWYRDDALSPPLAWVLAVLHAVEGRPVDPKRAVRLLRIAR